MKDYITNIVSGLVLARGKGLISSPRAKDSGEV